jgi:septal ring factor EnvC (AmiA/AmiB activator)
MNETTSLRWRAHATKAVINYHTLDRHEKEDDDEKIGAPTRHACCGATLMDGVAAAAVASSMITWMETSNILVKIASASTFMFGPFAAFQKRKLRNLGSLRMKQNHLREEVNYLYQEQERLEQNLQKLDSNVVQMENMERDLNRIAGNPQNVHRLLEVTDELRQVHEGIKENLKKSVLQNILTALVQSDTDKNFVIHAREMEILVVRLKLMDGVQFNEHKFRQAMGTGSQSLSSIMMMIRSLLQDDDETIFVLCPEEVTG